MKTTFYITGLLAGAYTIAIVASCNNAQSGDNMYANQAKISNRPDSMDNSPDAQFLLKVSKINKMEIKLGQLAEQNGTMVEVKDLGKMMEQDHIKAQEDLTALASKKSITLPDAADEDAQQAYNTLCVKAGNNFDKAFCDMMVNGHKDAINLFQKESTDAKDADIRQFAASTLPTLQKHLSHALDCQNKCKSTGSSM